MIGKYIIIALLEISFIFCSSQNIQYINNICNKIINKHSTTLNTVKDFLLNNNLEYKNENDYPEKSKLYNFFVGNQLEDEYDIDYFQIIKKYLINIYITPVIFLWIIFILLFFFKKCLFKSDLNINIILNISTFIIMIIFILISILSFIVILKSNYLEETINDASCNLLKFFYELNHGKIKESDSNIDLLYNRKKKDSWPGLYTLNSILLDTSEQITKLATKKDYTFSLLEEINNDLEELLKLINLLNRQSLKGLPNPNFNQKDEIFPIYVYEFNNISKNNSLINDIYSEYVNYFLDSKDRLDYIYIYSSLITNKSQIYNLQLNEIFDNISDSCYFIGEKSSNITHNIIVFQKHFECIIISIKFVNIICILFSIIIIILILIYFFKNSLWVKITLHISWNFSFFIIISFLCLWYFIANLSEGVENSIYLLENEVLKTNANIFFNLILNTIDSDLNIIFNIYNNDSALIEIDKYSKNIFQNLESLKVIEKDLFKIKQINTALNEVNKYLNNYELTTNSSYKENDISFILNNLSNITNNYKEGKINGYCDSNDIWVSSKNKCKDHKFITRYEIKNGFKRKKEEKYCFIIQDDYKESDLQKIYIDICSNESYSQIVNYVSGLTQYYNSNENLLQSLENILKEIERYYKKLSEIIVAQIHKCECDMRDLIDIYKPILGDTNITDLFKCGRLKRKLINYYDISYNHIANNCKSIKTHLIIIMLLSFLGIIFIIINNHRNIKEIKRRRYMKLQNKDLNNDGVELIEEVPGEDEDN